jgi:hypothetical protein
VDPIAIYAAIRDSFVVTVISGFLECLFLILALDAVRQAHRIYALAVLGLSATLVGRMAEGFMPSGPDTILKIGGLVLAGLVLTLDIVTEEVEITEEKSGP